MTTTLEQLQKRIKSIQDKDAALLEQFSEMLFSKAGPEFFNEFDDESLLAIALEAFKFIQEKAPGDAKVRVYNPSYQADGWEAPHTVLELCLADRPFIVDSVRMALRREGYELYHLLHPVFSLERDEAGLISQIRSRGQGVQEAYELYLIDREDDPKKLAELKELIETVLADVVLATDDYQAMRAKSAELRDYLRHLHEVSAQGYYRNRAEELEEYAAFMDWLDNDNFIFLGYREYDIFDSKQGPMLQVDAGSGQGILRKMEDSGYRQPVPISEIPEGLRERVTGGRLLIVTKTNAESTIHRPVRMDYIGLKKLSDNWQVRGEQRFVGLFTSKALSTPVEEIPILRLKLRQVIELDKAVPESHDYKQIVAIFNSMPREELFWSDSERLHKDIRTIMGLEQDRGVRLTLRPDPLDRGLAAMVIMPRDRFNTEVRRRIQQLLGQKLSAKHVDYQLAMGEDEAQVRFHFFFITDTSYAEIDMPGLEAEVTELTRTWQDHLLERLVATKGEVVGRRLAERYAGAFDKLYQADTSTAVALRDIEHIEKLADTLFLVDIINPLEDRRGEGASHVKIYHHQRALILSQILPVLENLGFKVLEQISYFAHVPNGEDIVVRGLDIFRVQDEAGRLLDVRSHGARLVEALEALLLGNAENDRLNRLVLYGELSIRQVALLRGYQMYYAQLSAVTSRRFINDTLLKHPRVAGLLYSYFAAKFAPDLPPEKVREQQLQQIKERFLESLSQVSSLPGDSSLRGLLNLIDATVRSNFFLDKDIISFKLDSGTVIGMPEPKPVYEIAVTGPGVEGTHLRGGKVARGGIRWSDRPDDFRTEVLGLMKTQMTKNAVIVPVGSKGGFVIKNAPTERESLRDYVKQQYTSFIRGLLDLTDNIKDGQTVQPQGLVVYDDPDPYLVVAADKGTATFSDLANETAAEYDFWLGDAFASGGSYGYDHKKEGITARGAWECVARHFREIGIDVMEQSFTVVAIGDMSGDVFGNGMLYSRKIKLQAAFNHLHIFLDPDPDLEKSFKERKRLFELPRSSWEDYNKKLISKGGGIYSRHAKSIPLSAQLKAMLGVSDEALSGQDLIKAVLKMPVDLLWNGGIGTYVKSAHERNTDVGDSNNDEVRIDADDLQAQVVGEGGNLGLTQLARIDYARAGGRINTDAIDNSAGVDMSDHEVNIKILLQPLLSSGDLSFVQRNRLLKEMTDDVSKLVLSDNYMQSLCLSLAERRSCEDVLLFESLQDYHRSRGDLKPKVEYLPGHKDYEDRHRAGEGLSRPELAILLAYTKMGIYRRLLETDFPNKPYFQHYLFDYFPKVLQERFPETIKNHPLRREIIATQFTNKVVDLLGITFVHRGIRDTGASPVEVIRAALVALEILAVGPFLERIFALDQQISTRTQYNALDDLVRAVEGIVNWILLNDLKVEPVADFVAAYCEPLAQLRRELKDLLPTGERNRYELGFEAFSHSGVPVELAQEIASLDYLPSGVGVIDVSRIAEVSLEEAGTSFYALGERLELGWLRDNLLEHAHEDKWEKIALGGLIMDLRRAQRQLGAEYCKARKANDALSPEAFLAEHPRLLERYDQALTEIKENDSLSLASGGVLARLLLQIAYKARQAKAV